MSLYKRPKADGSFAWWARVEYKGRAYQENLHVTGTDQKPNIKEAEKAHDLFKVRCINRGDEEAAVAAVFGLDPCWHLGQYEGEVYGAYRWPMFTRDSARIQIRVAIHRGRAR